MKRLTLAILVLALIFSALVPTSLAGSTAQSKDVYDRMVEEFMFGNYAIVMEIYEADLAHRSPLEQFDSQLYYFYAKAVYEVFMNKNYGNALLILEALPDRFNDVNVVPFRFYLQGLDYIEREMYGEARVALQNANGIFDSVAILMTLPKPSPSPIIMPTSIPARVDSPIAAPRQPSDPGIGIVMIHQVSKNGANLRAVPDPGAAMVGYVPMLTWYVCLSVAENGWKEILLPTGTKGFVSGKLVDYYPHSNSQFSRPTYSAAIGTVTPNTTSVITRAATDHDSDKMGSIKSGTSYLCVAVNLDGWCCIATPMGPEKGDWLVYVPMDSVTFTPYR